MSLLILCTFVTFLKHACLEECLISRASNTHSFCCCSCFAFNNLFILFYFETSSHYVTLAVLESTMYTSLASNSQKTNCTTTPSLSNFILTLSAQLSCLITTQSCPLLSHIMRAFPCNYS